MTTVQRQPPPPPLTLDPAFNRWLHDLIAFISPAGGIDVTQISGFTTLQVTVTLHTTQIAAANLSITTLQGTATLHTSQINTLQNQMITANSNITTLQSNAVVRNGSGAPSNGLGVNGDWYGDTTNKHIYIKVSGAYVLIV